MSIKTLDRNLFYFICHLNQELENFFSFLEEKDDFIQLLESCPHLENALRLNKLIEKSIKKEFSIDIN